MNLGAFVLKTLVHGVDALILQMQHCHVLTFGGAEVRIVALCCMSQEGTNVPFKQPNFSSAFATLAVLSSEGLDCQIDCLHRSVLSSTVYLHKLACQCLP